jgi:hypothetical protein
VNRGADGAGGEGDRKFAGELLLSCLREGVGTRDDLADLLSKTSLPVLIDHAIYHGVIAWLYRSLLSANGIPAGVLDELRPHHTLAAYNHFQGLWELAGLQPLLDRTGVPWAVLKGAAVVDVLYGGAGPRHYQDIDLLVDPAGFSTVVDTLQSSGSRLLDRNWRMIRTEMRGQVHLLLPRGTPGDLHWDLINVHRGQMQIDTAAVLARAQRVDLGGVAIPTLDATDSLIHLAVHASLSGGDRLIWLKDIELATSARPPSWEEAVHRAASWGVSRPVGLLLSRARSVLGADVPEGVTERMLGPWFNQLSRKIDRQWPPHLSRGGANPSRAISRAIGHGAIGGTIFILARLVKHLDPREPGLSSPFRAAGDARDRDRFFRAVTARTTPQTPLG